MQEQFSLTRAEFSYGHLSTWVRGGIFSVPLMTRHDATVWHVLYDVRMMDHRVCVHIVGERLQTRESCFWAKINWQSVILKVSVAIYTTCAVQQRLAKSHHRSAGLVQFVMFFYTYNAMYTHTCTLIHTHTHTFIHSYSVLISIWQLKDTLSLMTLVLPIIS